MEERWGDGYLRSGVVRRVTRTWTDTNTNKGGNMNLWGNSSKLHARAQLSAAGGQAAEKERHIMFIINGILQNGGSRASGRARRVLGRNCVCVCVRESLSGTVLDNGWAAAGGLRR